MKLTLPKIKRRAKSRLKKTKDYRTIPILELGVIVDYIFMEVK